MYHFAHLSFCRLNAGLQHAIDDSEHKTALYMQAKADKRLNLTFPPVKSQGTTAAINQGRLGYSFSSWSDSPVSTNNDKSLGTILLTSFVTRSLVHDLNCWVRNVQYQKLLIIYFREKVVQS